MGLESYFGSADMDEDQDKYSKPGIPRPGNQPDQLQQQNAPPQDGHRQPSHSSDWIPPTTGNPDLDPANLSRPGRIDLRDVNPLTPQGMLFDPRQLHPSNQDPQRPGPRPNQPPPGARFDPFGPPDPDEIIPGEGPRSSRFGNPDPDHFQPPGLLPPMGKNIKSPFPFQPRPPFGGPRGPGGFGGPGSLM